MLADSTSFEYVDSIDNFLLSSFDIIAATIWYGDISIDYLLASISPLPGEYTDFYSFATGLHEFIPYPMMGEWAAFSVLAGFLVYFIVGGLFAAVESRRFSPILILSTAEHLLLYVFMILSLQYTTRASTRMLVLLISINIGGKLWARIFRHRRIHPSVRSSG